MALILNLWQILHVLTYYRSHYRNQLDPANAVENYENPLDMPLGHHVVTDFTRRVAPYGQVSSNLDLPEVKMVYPLMALPGWVVSRYFYELARKVLSHLLLPLLSAYVIYRLVAYLIALGYGAPVGFLGTSQELPGVHVLFLDLAIFGLLVIIIFALFFFVIRHTLHKKLGALGSGEALRVSPAQISQGKIEAILKGKNPAPMSASLDPTAVDVFVSGHTHLPSLFKVERSKARKSVIVNSGCWLRQLQPVPVHFKGPPVFVSTFVLTHVRVYAKANSLQIELWKKQKAAPQRLSGL